jgi:hypothetical protein
VRRSDARHTGTRDDDLGDARGRQRRTRMAQ